MPNAAPVITADFPRRRPGPWVTACSPNAGEDCSRHRTWPSGLTARHRNHSAVPTRSVHRYSRWGSPHHRFTAGRRCPSFDGRGALRHNPRACEHARSSSFLRVVLMAKRQAGQDFRPGPLPSGGAAGNLTRPRNRIETRDYVRRREATCGNAAGVDGIKEPALFRCYQTMRLTVCLGTIRRKANYQNWSTSSRSGNSRAVGDPAPASLRIPNTVAT